MCTGLEPAIIRLLELVVVELHTRLYSYHVIGPIFLGLYFPFTQKDFFTAALITLDGAEDSKHVSKNVVPHG